MMIRAYQGNGPYIFVSYAHKDSDRVLPIISKMQDKGYNVWFDAGIEAGTEWPEYIAEHLYGCTVFLAFLSQSALASQNCRQEINFAVELKKEALLIHLDESEIPVGLRMRLGFTPQIHMSRHGSHLSFLEELFRNNLLLSCCEESKNGSKVSASAENAFLKGLSCDLDKDYAQAIKWYRQAADEGHAAAQYSLGCSYSQGEGVAKDMYEAVKWWRRAAEQGYLEAQYNLGCSLSSGTGTVKDCAEAARWFHMAAQKGHAASMNNLGNCYINGDGVAQNAQEAVNLFYKAAQQGNAEAQMALGNCFNMGAGVAKDMREAVRWWKMAGERGIAIAQHNLGICYANGIGVDGKNPAEAAKWYHKAADQGYDRAQLNLGVCYELGDGVPQDYTEAEKWYRKAAAQGNDKAREGLERIGATNRRSNTSGISVQDAVNLGKDYFNKRQYNESAQCFLLAAEQGHAEAQFFIGYFLCEGMGMEKNPAAGVIWYRRSAEQGFAGAQTFLGNCYASGTGVPIDYAEATRWFRLAAQQGDTTAQDVLRRNSISW